MWEQTEEMAKKHDADSSTWLKLANDQDTAVVVFVGDPYPREVSFIDGKYVPADDAVRAAGHKVSLRVAYNVVLPETGEMKVLEQGVMFFKDLVQVREKYGLEKWARRREGPEDDVLDPPRASAHRRGTQGVPVRRTARPAEALRRRDRSGARNGLRA
jgi:hypothetical protein